MRPWSPAGFVAWAMTSCIDPRFTTEDFACRTGGLCANDAAVVDATTAPDGAPDTKPDAGDSPSPDSGRPSCPSGPDGVWRTLSITGATPRVGHSVVVDTLNDRALIFGGDDLDPEVTTFSAGTSSFVQLVSTSKLQPPPRQNHAAAYIDEGDGPRSVEELKG